MGASHLAGHWLRWMRWNIFRFGIGSDVTAGVPRGLGSTRGLDLFYLLQLIIALLAAYIHSCTCL